MKLTVDASVAIKWFIEEPGHETALVLFDTDPLIAPLLLAAETANVAARKVRRGEIDKAVARHITDSVYSGYPELYDTTHLTKTCLDLALELDHDVYDCIYLGLSLSNGAPLVTADGKFYRKVQERRPDIPIHLIGAGATCLSDREIARIRENASLIEATRVHLDRVHEDPEVEFQTKSAQSFEVQAYMNSPAHKRLEQFLDGIPRFKLAEYITLCWLAVVPGRHATTIDETLLHETRARAVRYARFWDRAERRHRQYVVGLAARFEAGVELARRSHGA